MTRESGRYLLIAKAASERIRPECGQTVMTIAAITALTLCIANSNGVCSVVSSVGLIWLAFRSLSRTLSCSARRAASPSGIVVPRGAFRSRHAATVWIYDALSGTRASRPKLCACTNALSALMSRSRTVFIWSRHTLSLLNAVYTSPARRSSSLPKFMTSIDLAAVFASSSSVFLCLEDV